MHTYGGGGFILGRSVFKGGKEVGSRGRSRGRGRGRRRCWLLWEFLREELWLLEQFLDFRRRWLRGKGSLVLREGGGSGNHSQELICIQQRLVS